MTVNPAVSLWCAGALIAYLAGALTVGHKQGPVLPAIIGTVAAAIAFVVAGRPLPDVALGALLGGLSGAALLKGSAALRWGGSAGNEIRDKVREDEPVRLRKKDAAPKESAPAPAETENQTQALGSVESKTPAPASAAPKTNEPTPETAAPEDPSNMTQDLGGLSAIAKAKLDSESPGLDASKIAAASLDDDGRGLIPSSREDDDPQQRVERTMPLGTKAPIGAHSTSIPRGVFAMDEETPIALTNARRDPIELLADETEDIGDSVAPQECPRCAAPCDGDARFCAECSGPVVKWTCKECGRRNSAHADFCVRCQAPVELLASPVDVEILE